VLSRFFANYSQVANHATLFSHASGCKTAKQTSRYSSGFGPPIRSITERHSLSPSSHVGTAIGPSCDVLSLVGSDTDLSCSVGMTR